MEGRVGVGGEPVGCVAIGEDACPVFACWEVGTGLVAVDCGGLEGGEAADGLQGRGGGVVEGAQMIVVGAQVVEGDGTHLAA